MVPVGPITPPGALPPAEGSVWAVYEAEARKAGTLVEATAGAFAAMCRHIVLRDRLGEGDAAGTTRHQGMIRIVDAELRAFLLAPAGRAMPGAIEAPKDDFAEFDG